MGSVLLYADDTQLYESLKPSLKEEARVKLEACLSDIEVWFSVNKLICNSTKTKFIFFEPQSRSRCLSSPFSISFGSSILCPVDTAINLGVTWDKHLRMKSHISSVCKVASFVLSRIEALYNYLDKFSIERSVHAFISCRLDYCNVLLYGIPVTKSNRLQRIQIWLLG